jgi:hypothetical protein
VAVTLPESLCRSSSIGNFALEGRRDVSLGSPLSFSNCLRIDFIMGGGQEMIDLVECYKCVLQCLHTAMAGLVI